MFVFTMNKRGLKKAAVVVGCAAVLALSAVAVGGAISDTRAASLSSTQKVEFSSTNEMLTYLTSMGIEADLSSAKVDQVQIPKKWDDDFAAFNEVIIEGGLDLSGYKNKKVEKWDFVALNRSDEEQTVSAILLVYKEKLIGAYLISRPSGEVQALVPPAQSSSSQSVATAGEVQQSDSAQLEAAVAEIEQAAQQPGALPSE